MGYMLRREIRALIPPGKLSPLERGIVLEIADLCDDKSRKTWPGSDLLQLLVDKNNRAIEEALARIADKWVELRVELGKGSDGRPYYSHRGKATTFYFPPDAELRKAYEKATGIPWASSVHAALPGAIRKSKAEKAPEKSGASDQKAPDFSEEAPGFSGESPRENRGPSPQGSSPQNFNTSSLSQEGTSVTVACKPAEDRERDEVTSSEDPNLTWHQQFVIDANCPPHLAAAVSERLHERYPDRGPGWWRKVHRVGDLAELVKQTLQTLTQAADIQPASHTGPDCDTCWGSGLLTTETGTTTCPKCAVPEPSPARCPDHPNFPARTCGPCRADRHDPNLEYGDLNMQGRTSERGNLPTLLADTAPDRWQPSPPPRESAQARKYRECLEIGAALDAQWAAQQTQPEANR
jgi:hypothetical protein